VLALAGAAAAPGQEPAAGGAPPAAVRAITVQNLAPFPRREIAAAVVPFARGAVAVLPDLHAAQRATAWQPFGARWPDGSLRQALCLFAVELPAFGEATVPLVAGAGPGAETAGAFTPLPARLRVVVATGAGDTPVAAPVTVEPPVTTLLEDNALRRVELRSARLGDTGLVAELIVAQGRGDAHAYVDVAVFLSDPRTAALQIAVKELAVEADGMALLLRHPGRLGVQQATTARGSRVVLLHDTVLGDGQGIRRCGTLVPPLRGDDGIGDRTAKAAAVCPVLAALPWHGLGAFGPFGEPAELPPWLRGADLRAVCAQRHLAFATTDGSGDPFAVGDIGLAKFAGQTGDQGDFGIVKLSPVAASGLPSFLLECEASLLQEACRPVHMFDAAGAPLAAKDHPQWIVWSGRTHWHGEVSKDRLGKPFPEPPFETHGWTGKDRQHWSDNYLGAFAQLTGAHWARRELQNEVQLYLSGQTVDPALSTSGSDAPRGAGRTELAACWMYLATGDQDLLARMNERLDKVYWPQWQGRTLPEGKVRPYLVEDPDPRMLGGTCRYWNPWQDAIAACGFGAAWRLTGNEHGKQLAEELALNVLRHGWRVTDQECICAMVERWCDGEPLTEQQQQDPTCVTWAYGTAFSEWAFGAVEIARVAAIARGDAALRGRAETVQRRMREGRQIPADSWIDRLSEWDAVHW